MTPAPRILLHDLYAPEGLERLDAAFLTELCTRDVPLHNRLVSARAHFPPAREYSQLIVDLAPHLEDFLAECFGICGPLAALKERHFALAPLYACKRLFVQRQAAKRFSAAQAEEFDGAALRAQLLERGAGAADGFELAFARQVLAWLDAPADQEENLDLARRYAAWAALSAEGRRLHHDGVLFRMPRKTDPLHLVALETEIRDGITILKAPADHRRPRRGFVLTDDGGSLARTLDETNYCIWCHEQERDSCSKGLKQGLGKRDRVAVDSADPCNLKSETYKRSSLGIELHGCPLEEKISEMNFLKSEGIPIGALAAVVIDNPMCAGTGHRICNDCMTSCIYQKQEPVDVPRAETRTLRDVLELPYGFEIYSLLTRWNPLNVERPLPKPTTGRTVLVAGMGPAGYTLAHHLLNDGHIVVGIDGLKIEPLPPELSGVAPDGSPAPFELLRDASALFGPLDERSQGGFGGVAEYGITVRWDKNFLTILRLLLERRREFSLIGGVRFGGTVTIESAWEMGFDHIALCMGAGKPTVLDLPHGLARGVRAASDFLMALQLTGAAKADSIANLQLRLPVVVVGGGLTAIDTATEALAYYPVQVEQFLARHETLMRERGQTAVRAGWSEEDRLIAEEFIAHAKALRAERTRPHPDVASLLASWGGATIVYRRNLTDSPSYRLNHEEVAKAFQEGIALAEGLSPRSVALDRFGHVRALECTGPNAETVSLSAGAILVAAGTHPNTVLARESLSEITFDGRYFQALDKNGSAVTPARTPKPDEPQVLIAREVDGRAISFFGDLHPSYAGSVVKAMASAKQGYPIISRLLNARSAKARVADREFLQNINARLRATVHAVIRLTPRIVEVVIRAPEAARGFRPGLFYRLQNFEANALKVSRVRGQALENKSEPWSMEPETCLAMEGLAMTGAAVDRERGLVSLIVLEMGGSSDLCAELTPGEPVILMGPTGSPTEIPAGETLLLAGGGLGNAVLFSIGREARAKGGRVLYFAGYNREEDRYKAREIENASDAVIWCCDETLAFVPSRPQDRSFHGSITAGMAAYARGDLGACAIALSEVDRIIAIGSAGMMEAVARTRHADLAPYLKSDHAALGSINSPMQCMMKEICAQCLQEHVDPATGQRRYVFSCSGQDQALDQVSFAHLAARLGQNALPEKLTAQWIDRSLIALGRR